MDLDFRTLPRMDRYKLLVSSIVPRPIALVTTLSKEGVVNAAPFSFFNAVSAEPPLVVLGLEVTDYAPRKDTGDNIRDTGEFVVSLVSEEIAPQMNLCAMDFPADEDELAETGLTPMPSTVVKAPWIKESPVSFECKRMATMEVGTGNRVVVGEVVYMHIADQFVDQEKMYVDAPAMKLIGRMHGRGWYVRTADAFDMPRIAYADWAAERDKKRGA
ncbi:MAG: flavin reductase family protein [Alphaproteobacteria bacterium]|nr:flavin reductase family protein [Alphaproteobacteria bacterium]